MYEVIQNFQSEKEFKQKMFYEEGYVKYWVLFSLYPHVLSFKMS